MSALIKAEHLPAIPRQQSEKNIQLMSVSSFFEIIKHGFPPNLSLKQLDFVTISRISTSFHHSHLQ